MSTEERKTNGHDTRSMNEHIMADAAKKAITRIEEQALRGVIAVSQMAHRTTDQIDRATDYLQQAVPKTLDTAKSISESARKNLPMILLSTAVGFGLGYILWRQPTTETRPSIFSLQ